MSIDEHDIMTKCRVINA